MKEEYTVSTLDLLILLVHVIETASRKDIGFEDADRTFKQMEECLQKPHRLKKEVLESALWACRMCAESPNPHAHLRFWHPHGLTFSAWAREFYNKLGVYVDAFYGTIRPKNE